MIISNGNVKRFIPEPGLGEQELMEIAIPFSQASLYIANMSFSHLEMNEFPTNDGWSKLMMSAIVDQAAKGNFDGRTILGLGIGDGRNERLAANLANVGDIIGMDYYVDKLPLVFKNFENDEIIKKKIAQGRVRLYEGDAVDFLLNWKKLEKNYFSGTAFICLPQAKGDGTGSDIDKDVESHKPFRKKWDRYGLTLNAATLTRLSEISTGDAQALLVLSGRLPEEIRDKLIRETGWVNKGIVEKGIVKQDGDTPLSWMNEIASEIDDGRCFFADAEGKQPISILKAISMHERGEEVYHNVYVYQLGLKTKL